MTTLIIGGGLSGLAVAHALQVRGQDYFLVEARTRLGGRIKTEHHDGGAFDMGPTWFWPGQPRIADLIERLNLSKLDQFSVGDLVYENEQGQVRRGRGLSSVQGSWRLVGGLGVLIDALASLLPVDRVRLDAEVTALIKTRNGIDVTLKNRERLRVDRVIFCMPPRVAANLSFTPALPENATMVLQNIPTWMAGQAKAIATYDTPFWREVGLSGDAQSRFGPMVEIHDASPEQGGAYALFGFIGVPPQGRADKDTLRQHLIAQLTRLFGPKAAQPTRLLIKDWAFDPFTATKADMAPLHAHPTYGLPEALTGLWGKKLLFSGSELAPQFGGYLEGALEAAENVLSTLQK